MDDEVAAAVDAVADIQVPVVPEVPIPDDADVTAQV
jgi:hypothetical protein